MSTLKEIVGANIKAQRKRVGISQDELGERVDLSVTAIGMIERGVSWPQYENLAAIAIALGCDERILIATEPVKSVTQGISRPLLARIIAMNDSELENLSMFLEAHSEVDREIIESDSLQSTGKERKK